ncbi:MAG TPA: ABC transporter permease [Vicinamibacterales bacterium]|nr:ABC transporter permease [Vicinamibacterales bacterium]
MLDDVRTAVRSLRSTRGFTLVAVAVLALGIGSATAIFSIVDAVTLRALPFDEHDRLAALYQKDTHHATTFGEGDVTPQTFLDWRASQRAFQAIAMAGSKTFRLETAGGEPADARAERVTWEFFPVLHASPMLGRAFSAKDEAAGAGRVVVLSYGFWQRRFGAAPDAVGTTLDLSDEPYEVVGVMPRTFTYPVGSERPADVFVPRVFRAEERVKSGGHCYCDKVVGRLRDGVTFAQAKDEMFRLSEQLDRQSPKWEPGRRAVVVPLHDFLVGKMHGWMLMLLGSVVLVLLIACANVANLLLVRATGRGRAIGIRSALGAGRWRIVRGLMAEGLLLALAGAAIGIAIAYAGVNVLRAWLPANVPRVASIAIDTRVLAAAVGAAIVTGLVFGVVPALQLAGMDLNAVLREGGRSSTSGKGAQRARSALVVAEVALALVLLVGAGLFTGSFVQLMRIDPGFDYHDVLDLGISLPFPTDLSADKGYGARNRAYILHAVDAVRRLPGVEMVALGGAPLSGSWARGTVTLPGRGELKGDGDEIDMRTVSEAYLQLLRMPLIEGRYLTAGDMRVGAPPVVVVNGAAARKYWPGQDALGQRIKVGGKDRVVVGIVGNVHQLGLEIPPRQECYVPLDEQMFSGELLIRTSGDPIRVLPSVKAAIWSINREQRFSNDVVTLEQYMDRQIAQRRFNMALLGLFGILGLVIAAIGIYGVMAYLVAQRTTEIGVRIALGATPGDVVGMVLRRAAALVGAGLVMGSVAAWYLAGGVRTFLFEVQPNDVRIFAAALVVLAASALLASALPAYRAASVDPLMALKAE